MLGEPASQLPRSSVPLGSGGSAVRWRGVNSHASSRPLLLTPSSPLWPLPTAVSATEAGQGHAAVLQKGAPPALDFTLHGHRGEKMQIGK